MTIELSLEIIKSEYLNIKNSFINRDINYINNFASSYLNMSRLCENTEEIISEFTIQYIELQKILNLKFYKTNFKKEKDYPFYKFLTDLNINLKIDNILCENLIKALTCLNKGQHLLKKLITKNFIDNKLTYELNKNLLHESAYKGTLPTFLFWYNLIEYKMNYNAENILVLACANSDIRILKWILYNLNKFDMKKEKANKSFYCTLFRKIFLRKTFQNRVPLKIVLRKLKMVSKHFNFVPYFKELLLHMDHFPDALEVVFKYYYKKSLYHLLNETLFYSFYETSPFISIVTAIQNYSLILTNENPQNIYKIKYELVKKIFNILNTKEERKCFILFLFVMTGSVFNYDINKIDCHVSYTLTFIDSVIDKIVNYINYTNTYRYNEHVIILKFLRKGNSITKYLEFIDNKTCYHFYKQNALILLSPYSKYIRTKNTKLIKINYINYWLRINIKRKLRDRYLKTKIKYYPLIHEIENFKPNINIPILRNGSIKYRLDKQLYNNIPSYHIYPNEINYLDNFLIREKADGILINSLPQDTKPKNNIIFNYQVKAEYIEELNLYLVFDINLPDTTIEERYLFLRNLHPYTNNTKLLQVKNFTELNNFINEERSNLNNFLKEDYNFNRWYPKCAYKVKNINTLFRNEIIKNIILEEDYLNICENGIYKCDGLILSPLNGKKEIKIKPKSLMTIDLLWNGVNWIDREGNNWAQIIQHNPEINISPNTIWRCYPCKDNKKFIAKELRYDKIKSNPWKVVATTIKLINYNWNTSIILKPYYHKNAEQNIEWFKIINKQNIILEEQIKLLNALTNQSWLDLGCGKGKILHYILKYNPKEYLGLDIDKDRLINAIHKFDKKINYNIEFIPSDLSKEWNTEDSWSIINMSKKYDFIVSNFSIMHFFTDKFWEQINKISKINTHMLFNVVNFNAKNKFNQNKSYLFLDENNKKVKYYFDSIHAKEISEEFISEKKIDNILKKYNWTLVNKYTSKIHFLNYYTWYIIKKN